MSTQTPPSIRRPWERHRFYTQITGESMTHQSHAESCDINQIIRRYDNTGLIPEGRGPGQYGDVSHLQTAQTADLILESRQTLEKANRDLKDHKSKKAQAEKDRIAAIEAENAALKESQKTPPSPSPSNPSQDD